MSRAGEAHRGLHIEMRIDFPAPGFENFWPQQSSPVLGSRFFKTVALKEEWNILFI